MTKVFLDTNVLMDYVDNRINRRYTEILFSLADLGKFKLYASYLSLANMSYILRKRPRIERTNILVQTCELVQILDCTAQQLKDALSIQVSDFEDMLQYQCAVQNKCDVIITENKQDFEDFSVLSLYTIEEFLYEFNF